MTEQEKNAATVFVIGLIIGILLNGSPNDGIRVLGFAAFIIAVLVSTAFRLAESGCVPGSFFITQSISIVMESVGETKGATDSHKLGD